MKAVSLLRALTALFPVLSLACCSLNYGQEAADESSVPELVFGNVRFMRHENGKMSLLLNAEQLEQYKSGGISVAENAEFSTFDNAGAADTSGRCDLLAIDGENSRYSLFGGIEILSAEENARIQAESLKWDSENEQLVSSEDDVVHISRDDLEMSGRGFSASGISRSYKFSGSVEGEISTKEDAQSTDGGAAE